MQNMNREFYTKLIYEHKCPDDHGPERVEVSKTVWDADSDDVFDMFHTIFIGAGFSEDNFIGELIGYLEDRGYTVSEVDEHENN